MIKTLLIGGVHGDEATGVELVNELENKPISGIETLLANPEAVKQNLRFIETDLNRSFGANIPISSEEKLASDLSPKLKNYDLILDFHNTNDSTTCGIVCNFPNDLQLKIAAYFGFDKIVIMPNYGCLIGVETEKSISFEISEFDTEQLNKDYLYTKLSNLSEALSEPSKIPANQIKTYNYVTSVQKKTFERPKNSMGNIQNFTPFTSSQKAILNLENDKEYCPIFYGCEAYVENAFHIVELNNAF